MRASLDVNEVGDVVEMASCRDRCREARRTNTGASAGGQVVGPLAAEGGWAPTFADGQHLLGKVRCRDNAMIDGGRRAISAWGEGRAREEGGRFWSATASGGITAKLVQDGRGESSGSTQSHAGHPSASAAKHRVPTQAAPACR